MYVRHLCHPTNSPLFQYKQAYKPFADPIPPNNKQYQLILIRYQPVSSYTDPVPSSTTYNSSSQRHSSANWIISLFTTHLRSHAQYTWSSFLAQLPRRSIEILWHLTRPIGLVKCQRISILLLGNCALCKNIPHNNFLSTLQHGKYLRWLWMDRNDYPDEDGHENGLDIIGRRAHLTFHPTRSGAPAPFSSCLTQCEAKWWWAGISVWPKFARLFLFSQQHFNMFNPQLHFAPSG